MSFEKLRFDINVNEKKTNEELSKIGLCKVANAVFDVKYRRWLRLVTVIRFYP